MNIEQLIQSVKDYFTTNPNMSGLLVAALGVLLFVGTIFKWEWVLAPSNKFSLLRSIFGARGQMFVCSTLIILGGIAIFLFI